MESVKEIIAANLTELRKKHKLTQQQLAEKLNYSDKAISRWEHAETLPDIDTLCKICDIYGVRFEYLLQKEQPKKNNPYIIKTNVANRIIIMFIAVCVVWITALVAYIYTNTIFNINAWTIFIWAIPITFFICQLYNRFFFGKRILKCVFDSLAVWSLLLSIYLQLLEYNIWMLFVIGVPLQAITILMTILKISTGKEFGRKKEEQKE